MIAPSITTHLQPTDRLSARLYHAPTAYATPYSLEIKAPSVTYEWWMTADQLHQLARLAQHAARIAGGLEPDKAERFDPTDEPDVRAAVQELADYLHSLKGGKPDAGSEG